MGIFNHSKNEGNHQIEDVGSDKLPPDPHKIDAARAARLKRLSHMPGPGVLRPDQSHRIQAWAEDDAQRQEKATLEAGAAAEEAGRVALEATEAASEVPVDHRLSA